MTPKRFLVISRAPAGRIHLDIVIARNEALAEDKVRQMRKGIKVAAKDRGQSPVAITTEEVQSILDAMEFKSSLDIEKKFNSLLIKKDTWTKLDNL
jgi:DNA invertase Pin-like site-specific DNA recombinase